MDNQIYTHSYFVNTLKAHVELDFSLPPMKAAKAIEVMEQQQREIDKLRSSVQEIANYGTSTLNGIDAWRMQNIAIKALSPKEDQTTPTVGMSHNDKFQLDYLIKEFGADFILDYVNDFAHREVPTDIQDDISSLTQG